MSGEKHHGRRLRHCGTVMAVDRVAGTVKIDVRYHDRFGHIVPEGRREPVTIPFPDSMPDWCRQPGAEFLFEAPPDYTKEDLSLPGAMTGFSPEPLWWLTPEELGRIIDGSMADEEYAAVMAREPLKYSPPLPPGKEPS